MGIIADELKAYYNYIEQLNVKGFIKVKTGYLLSFLNYSPAVYLVTYDARVFMRFKFRNFREELHVLIQDGEVPKNYMELDKAPDRVLEKMEGLNLEHAIALGLLR